MAVPVPIEDLIRGRIPGEKVEFLPKWDSESVLKTVCAFANDLENRGGGYLVIEDPGNEEDIWDQIRPDYRPFVETVNHEGKTYLQITASGGSLRPYSLPSPGKDSWERTCYIRQGSETLAATGEAERELCNLAGKAPFDGCPNRQASPADLNMSLLQSFLKDSGSPLYGETDLFEICSRMNLVYSNPDVIWPRNAALLFFNLNPDRFFPYAQIDVVQFPDGTGGDRIIEKTFKGPLDFQLQSALQYIRNSVLVEMVIKRPDRAEADRFFNYPFTAVKEALTNAVFHRGYDIREPIEVRIEPDRMEILSFPGPETGRYRNPRIGELLGALRLVEGENRGLEKIRASLKGNGSPEAEFVTDEDHSYFITRFFPHPYFLS